MTALPEGYSLRHAALEDAPAVAALYNDVEAALGSNHVMTESEILQYLRGLDLENNSWLVLDPNGILVAYEELDPNPEKRYFHMDGVVHPDHQGRGIGTFLVRAAEDRADTILQGLNDSDTEGPRPFIAATFSALDQAAKDLFRDYTLAKSDMVMKIEFDDTPPAPDWPAGFTVRTFQDEDARAVHAVVDEAFRSISGYADRATPFDDWYQHNVAREGFDPSLWFLVMDGDTIAAVTLCPHDTATGWIRQVAVLPAYRGHRLGKGLMLHSFNEWWSRGQRVIGLAVQGDNLPAQRLYESVGMQVENHYETYHKYLDS